VTSVVAALRAHHRRGALRPVLRLLLVARPAEHRRGVRDQRARLEVLDHTRDVRRARRPPRASSPTCYLSMAPPPLGDGTTASAPSLTASGSIASASRRSSGSAPPGLQVPIGRRQDSALGWLADPRHSRRAGGAVIDGFCARVGPHWSFDAQRPECAERVPDAVMRRGRVLRRRFWGDGGPAWQREGCVYRGDRVRWGVSATVSGVPKKATSTWRTWSACCNIFLWFGFGGESSKNSRDDAGRDYPLVSSQRRLPRARGTAERA
jgi:hypothetical protein